MGKYTGLTAIIAENMIEGSSFKANGETITVDEAKMAKAKDALGEAVRGLMRDFWNLKEGDENSLENLDGEVNIEELMDKKTDGTGSVPALGESLSFDIKKIVESIMEDPSEEGSEPSDGDEDFENAAIGHDEANMGGDLEQDGEVDSDAGELGDEENLDDGGDDLGSDDSADLDDLGSDDGFEDLSFADLDDLGGDDLGGDDLGDEFGSEETEEDALMGDSDEGEADLGDEGEAPIGKPAMESKQPLAKMKGGSKKIKR